jgi:UDP-N-acetylglucosamine 2-epimerase (non-hydrolysing)
MPKTALVIGTRPEAIKMAPVYQALAAGGEITPLLCNTAQHRELLDPILATFDLVPDVDLSLMQPDQTLADLCGRAIPALDRWLASARPDLVLVQGDTTTVLCAAMAAFYQGIPVGHVEAGLRTGDLRAPFPEEMNRVVTTRLAHLHFAPTVTARANLRREGVPADHIHVTGNTVIDALLQARERIAQRPPTAELPPGMLDADQGPLVLITGHRRENFGAGFQGICRAIAELARRFTDHRFVYPVHLNPQVQRPVREHLGGLANVHLLPPMNYLPFVALMDRAHLVLTDSGGIQEEAPSLGKPVLVLRETTERPEAVTAGTVKLVGTDPARIVAEAVRLLTDPEAHAAMARVENPYGDGHAAPRIAAACRGFLLRRSARK